MSVGADTANRPADRVSRAWPRSAVILVVIAATYSLVVLGLCGAGIWAARTQTLRMVQSQASAVAAFSAAYTSRMYDLSDEVTRRLAEEMKGAPLEPAVLAPMLADAAEGTAQNDYFLVFGPDGRLIASSQPMKSFRIQDDALSAHRAGAPRFVGQVVRGRATGEVIYRLSRRIEGPDGRLSGIVGAAIRPFGVRRVAERGAKDPQVTVWTDSGAFLAAAFVDFDRDGTAVAPPRPPGLGSLVPGQVRDADGRIRAEARVEGFPLWVSVEFDRSGVLGPWRAAATGTALLGAFLLVMGWGFAFAGLRMLARDEAARQRLANAKAEAEAALRDRELLLREIHHRVRNSLMLVSSFLMLQARAADARTRAALEVVRARVTSIGVVHETLYAGSHLGRVRVAEYLDRLLPELAAGLGARERGVTITCDAADITVGPEQATTLGLIVSEAVTNALKYAFEDGPGRIDVVARRPAPDLVELCIRDNGKGFQPATSAGLGSQLLQTLAAQLGGQCAVDSREGATVKVTFPAPAPLPAESA